MLSQLRDIADRYLARTVREVDELQDLIAQALGGDATAVKQTEQLAHKIHGSGAMFGFHDVSEYAGNVERLVVDGKSNVSAIARELNSAAAQLRTAVRQAASERGVIA
jgi:HPt (histidine-containing phosphotransfer) domain-containing protein